MHDLDRDALPGDLVTGEALTLGDALVDRPHAAAPDLAHDPPLADTVGAARTARRGRERGVMDRGPTGAGPSLQALDDGQYREEFSNVVGEIGIRLGIGLDGRRFAPPRSVHELLREPVQLG